MTCELEQQEKIENMELEPKQKKEMLNKDSTSITITKVMGQATSWQWKMATTRQLEEITRIQVEKN